MSVIPPLSHTNVPIKWKLRLIHSYVKQVGSSQNRPFWSTCIREKLARHAKSQLIHLQLSLLKSDSANAHLILSLQMTKVCFIQPFNNGMTAYEYCLGPPLSVAFTNFLSIKDLEILDEINILKNLHLRSQKCVCASNFRRFGEAKSSLQQHIL